MKKRIVRIASALLIGALSLVSCRSSGEPVLSFGSSVITENQFQYYISTYKNAFISTYTDVEDTSAFYNSLMPDGRTGEEFLFDMTVENVSMTLVCMELFERNGLSFDKSLTNAIDAEINDMIEEYAGGDKRALNSRLADYGINVNILREIYINEEKTAAVYDYLFGDRGTIGVTDGDRDAYYRENYVHFSHIYVNNKYYYAEREDGFTERDENGNLIPRVLEGEQLAEKNATIAEIDAALAAGADFNTVYEQYSEDQYYENGYYLTPTTNFIPEVTDAAFALEIGEYTKVESDYGVHYILRLELDEKPWEEEDNADFFGEFESTLRYNLFVAYVQQYLPEVVRDDEKLAAYSVEGAVINYRF